jgi:hypothetical protein
MNYQPVEETSDNKQHSKETDIHVPGRIRTSSFSKKAAAYPRLIMHGMNSINDGNFSVQLSMLRNTT